MTLRVDVSGVQFWGHLPTAGYGFVVDPEGLDGIDDGVVVKGETVSRPSQHGDYELPTFLESRIVSLSGNCLADSPERLGTLRRQFTGLLVGAVGNVVFEHLGSTVWGRAGLAPGVQKKFKVDAASSTHARFQLQLKFHDPRLFGESKPFAAAASLSLRHYGNFLSLPALEVTGSMPSGYSVNGPDGRKYTVTQALTPGQTHRIDMNTGRLYRNGVLQVGWVSRSETWGIPAGSLGVAYALAPVSGSGLISAPSVLDTFI